MLSVADRRDLNERVRSNFIAARDVLWVLTRDTLQYMLHMRYDDWESLRLLLWSFGPRLDRTLVRWLCRDAAVAEKIADTPDTRPLLYSLSLADIARIVSVCIVSVCDVHKLAARCGRSMRAIIGKTPLWPIDIWEVVGGAVAYTEALRGGRRCVCMMTSALPICNVSRYVRLLKMVYATKEYCEACRSHIVQAFVNVLTWRLPAAKVSLLLDVADDLRMGPQVVSEASGVLQHYAGLRTILSRGYKFLTRPTIVRLLRDGCLFDTIADTKLDEMLGYHRLTRKVLTGGYP